MIPKVIDIPIVRLAIRLIPAGLLLWIVLQTGYKIGNRTLHITFGPIRKKIPIQEIQRVEKTKDPFVAPALSSDRLVIHHGSFQFVSISPKDQNEFIHNLCEKNSAIKVDKKL